MLTTQIIEKFLQKKASEIDQHRGYQIYRDGGVHSVKFSRDQKTVYGFVVWKNVKYSVTVSNYNNPDLNATCSCNTGWYHVCQHSVAVLIHLKTSIRMENISPEIVRMVNTQRHSSEPLILEGIESSVDDLIYELENATGSGGYNEFETEKINLDNQGLIYTIHERFFPSNKFIVKLYAEDEKHYCFCSCNNRVKFTCRHETYVLKNFLKAGKKGLKVLKPGYADQLYYVVGQEYAIPQQYITENNVKLELDDKLQPHVMFAGQLKGLLPSFDYSNNSSLFSAYIKSIKKEEGTIQKLFSNPDENILPGFVFTFQESIAGFYTEKVTPITGKANKDNTRLISKYEMLSNNELYKLRLSDEEREVIRLANELPETRIPVGLTPDSKINFEKPEYFYKHRLMMRIFTLLNGYPNVFFQHLDVDGIRKQNLTETIVSDAPLQISARLVADEHFVSLVPVLKIGDETRDFHIGDFIMHSPMIWEYKSCLHLVCDISQIMPMLFFSAWPMLKSHVSRMADFMQNIVFPFSSRFNIDVEGLESIELNEVFLTPMKKQVFLSESEGFMLFKPMVAYSHKKEVLVMSGHTPVDYQEGKLTVYRRQEEFESDYMDFLRSLHPEFEGQQQEEALALPLNEIMNKHWFFDAFEAMQAKNVEVLGLQYLKSFKYSPYRATIRTGISSGIDWFDLTVDISFGEYEVPLKTIRKHIIDNEKYIRLGDGSIGILPAEWIEKLKKYFRVGEIEGDKLVLSKLRFSLIDELFDQIDDTAVAQELAEKRQRIQNFEKITEVKKPSAIKAQLRDYQKAGLNWLGFLNEMKWGGILADDMGLGKTVQVLSFLATVKSAKPKTSLVVVPTTLIFNWENEIKKFYPAMKVLFYYSPNRDESLLQSNDYQLVITTYGIMINDIEHLKEIKFNYIILDESQAIKNPLSKRYKAACLLQGKNRLTLTGTPIENNTFDLYAQMNFVNPGMLGNQKFFKEQYSNPIDKDQDNGRANELRKLVTPFILRRTKEQVATELPPKTEDVIWCSMEHDQFRIYEEYRDKYKSYLLNKIDENGLEKSKMFVLEGLLKLRQICNSPELLKDEEDKITDSVKLDELMRQINEKTGNHKIVVFSQFVKMLKIIERELKREGHDYEYFDGSSVQKQRRESVTRFQEDPKCRVFLISLKAGGTGINLTSADYVYIFDPWWNPAVENQAIDRTYRIGQDKKVFAYRMICKNTVEEKIMKYQERKKALAADIIRTEESFIKHLTKEDIGELFG